MQLTLDPRSQLQSGLLAYLLPTLAPLLRAPDALRTGWPDPQLSRAIATTTFSPVVSIWIGDYAPAAQQPTGGSTRTAQAPVTAQGLQGTVTVLTEVARVEAPVTFVILAGGVRGRPVAGAVAAALIGLLGMAVDIPLPDSYETETEVDPTITTFGLHARLVYRGDGEVHDRTEQRDLHRLDVRYRATQSRYRPETQTLIQGVGITLATAIGEGAIEILSPATP